MGDTTGFLLYLATVVVLAGSVVLADLTRSVTVTDVNVSVRTLGITVVVPVEEVRLVTVERTGHGAVRVVVHGRRPWHCVRVDTPDGSTEAHVLESFLDAAGRLGAQVTGSPAQAA